MAVNFVLGDVVTPNLQGVAVGGSSLARSALGPAVQPMGGLPIGTVNGGTLPATNVDVAWAGNSGGTPSSDTGLVPVTLDILSDPDSTLVSQLLGHVVKVAPANSQESPEMQGTVTSMYVRNLGGDTAVKTPTLALVKLQDGSYREVQADQLTVVEGR